MRGFDNAEDGSLGFEEETWLNVCGDVLIKEFQLSVNIVLLFIKVFFPMDSPLHFRLSNLMKKC
jgi:hypothetical protein